MYTFCIAYLCCTFFCTRYYVMYVAHFVYVTNSFCNPLCYVRYDICKRAYSR